MLSPSGLQLEIDVSRRRDWSTGRRVMLPSLEVPNANATNHLSFIATRANIEARLYDSVRELCIQRGFEGGEEFEHEGMILSYNAQDKEKIKLHQPPGETQFLEMGLVDANNIYGVTHDRLWYAFVLLAFTPAI